MGKGKPNPKPEPPVYQQLVKRLQAEAIQQTLAQEKELSELKLRFFSMVSHEFGTPLSIILGSAQLLAQSNQHWNEEKKLKNLYCIPSSKIHLFIQN